MKVASKTVWTRLGEVASLVATPLLPSHYIALFAPLATSRTRQARVEAIHAETRDVTTITLRPARGWRTHVAGQHVRVGLAVEGRIATRTYTISSPPDRRDGCIAITVKAQGRVSRVLCDIEVGTFVTLSPALGEFVLPVGAPVRPLLITAGSGITPIASMLRSLATSGHMLDIVHIHYARTPADMIFGAELRALATSHPSYRLIEVHTQSDARRFSSARLAELVPDWTAREAWACGPATLLASVTEVFADRPHALHVERFRAALAVLPNAAGGVVQFGGIKTRADGRTPLLRIAEDAGLSPPHGCRMGICHSCDSTLVSGCVRDLRTGATITEPGAQIQICVCAAAGDLEVALPGQTK